MASGAMTKRFIATHSVTGVQIKDLSAEQAEALAVSFSETSRANWSFEISQTETDQRTDESVAPALDLNQTNDEPLFETAHSPTTSPQVTLQIEIFDKNENRWIPNLALEATMAGMKLEHPIPAYMHGLLKVNVLSGPERLELVCSAFRANSPETKQKLTIESCSNARLLKSMISKDI